MVHYRKKRIEKRKKELVLYEAKLVSIKRKKGIKIMDKKLENIKQHHLVGTEDNVVLKEVFFSYLNKFEDKSNISYSFYEATHNCCWEDVYMKFR